MHTGIYDCILCDLNSVWRRKEGRYGVALPHAQNGICDSTALNPEMVGIGELRVCALMRATV